MNAPTILDPIAVSPDTHALSAYLPLPGFGVVPANAFVIHADQPMLVDAGVIALKDGFLDQLSAVIAPESLRWIWLTHTDPDHIGALDLLMQAAPQANVITTFLGMGKIGLRGAIAPERFHLINPGQSVDLGDRILTASRPPVYDAPETLSLFDGRSRFYYSADAFGAVLPQPVAAAEAVAPATLRDGVVTWATIDVPWLAQVARPQLERALSAVADLRPHAILSGHLPPARGFNQVLVDSMIAASTAPPFVGPSHNDLLRAAAG